MARLPIFLDTNVYRRQSEAVQLATRLVQKVSRGPGVIITEDLVLEILAIPDPRERTQAAENVLSALGATRIYSSWLTQVRACARQFLDGSQPVWEESARHNMLVRYLREAATLPPETVGKCASHLRASKRRWKEMHQVARSGVDNKDPLRQRLEQAEVGDIEDIAEFVKELRPLVLQWTLVPQLPDEIQPQVAARPEDFIESCPFARSWLTVQLYFMHRHGIMQAGIKQGKTIDFNDAGHAAWLETVGTLVTDDGAFLSCSQELNMRGLLMAQACTPHGFLSAQHGVAPR